MPEQEQLSFGEALKLALRAAPLNQAMLARHLGIDPGQVSRWASGKAIPHIETVRRMEEILGADLSTSFVATAPDYELYVSAPITGLSRNRMSSHYSEVEHVVEVVRKQVDGVYWPGEGIRAPADLQAPDLATERNLPVLAHCSAFLFLQFAEIVHPSSSLIELGVALGRRLKTTIILLQDVPHAYMLDGFGAVAAGLSFLPTARIYTVRSGEEACVLIERNGRALLGLN